LSQLDSNFATTITLGNTAIQLGNTVTTLNNMTLANVTVSSGNVTFTNVSATTANVTTANIGTAVITTANVTTANITTAAITTANVTTANVSTAISYSGTLTGGTGIVNLGSGQLYKDASGNVGIGTSSPGSKLDVKQSGANWYDGVKVVRSTNDNQRLVLGNTSGASYIASVDAAAGSNNALLFGRSTDGTTFTESMRIDPSGNAQMQTGAVMPYAPAPAAISAAATLSNANIQGQIISATGTTYTITMPLGTTLDTLVSWAAVNIGYDFFVINTASGVITMAVNTGVTSLGSLTIAIGASAHFRIRRTAASTYVLYRLV